MFQVQITFCRSDLKREFLISRTETGDVALQLGGRSGLHQAAEARAGEGIPMCRLAMS